MNKWPILYDQVLEVNNPKNPVGVAIMWTERQVVKDLLKGTEYAAIGNLYSSAGISFMIRNIYANPNIRKIILWGADLSRSGQALVEFMKYGVDEEFFIEGDEKKGQIEPEIGMDAIEHFRKNVEVVNLRGKSPKDLQKTVKELGSEAIEPFSAPKTFPSSTKKRVTYPSEQIGVRVHGETTAQTWLKVLNNIMRYGRNKKTRYTKENDLKELLNIIAVVYNEDIDDPYFPEFFPFAKKDLKTYYPQVVSSKKIPGIAYTYGQRLRDHEGVDQIQEMIELIKRRPFSKKQIAFTANIAHDWARDNVDRGDTPCLTQVITSIQDDKVFMTTHFRSQDMVHGWPRNVFSLMKLQDLICKETKVARGPFCMITHSAHIYSDDYELVEEILAHNYEKELGFSKRQHFEEDRRGNVIVEVQESNTSKRKRKKEKRRRGRPSKGSREYEIVAKLYAPDGGLLLQEWRGKTAMDVYIEMTDWDTLVMPSHLIYIGTELQRAEYAIKQGRPHAYSQDPAPNKGL